MGMRTGRGRRPNSDPKRNTRHCLPPQPHPDPQWWPHGCRWYTCWQPLRAMWCVRSGGGGGGHGQAAVRPEARRPQPCLLGRWVARQSPGQWLGGAGSVTTPVCPHSTRMWEGAWAGGDGNDLDELRVDCIIVCRCHWEKGARRGGVAPRDALPGRVLLGLRLYRRRVIGLARGSEPAAIPAAIPLRPLRPLRRHLYPGRRRLSRIGQGRHLLSAGHRGNGEARRGLRRTRRRHQPDPSTVEYSELPKYRIC